MRPDLTTSSNSAALPRATRASRSSAGKQLLRDLAERRQVDGGGEDVVRRLPHVHVVVRVHVVARERGDDLVRVHVRRRARAGLEDVDRELVVELAVGDATPAPEIRSAFSASSRPELGVHARGGGLDPAEPPRDRRPGSACRRRGSCRSPSRSRPPRAALGPRSPRDESSPRMRAAAAGAQVATRVAAKLERPLAQPPPQRLAQRLALGPAEVAAARALAADVRSRRRGTRLAAAQALDVSVSTWKGVGAAARGPSPPLGVAACGGGCPRTRLEAATARAASSSSSQSRA